MFNKNINSITDSQAKRVLILLLYLILDTLPGDDNNKKEDNKSASFDANGLNLRRTEEIIELLSNSKVTFNLESDDGNNIVLGGGGEIDDEDIVRFWKRVHPLFFGLVLPSFFYKELSKLNKLKNKLVSIIANEPSCNSVPLDLLIDPKSDLNKISNFNDYLQKCLSRYRTSTQNHLDEFFSTKKKLEFYNEFLSNLIKKISAKDKSLGKLFSYRSAKFLEQNIHFLLDLIKESLTRNKDTIFQRVYDEFKCVLFAATFYLIYDIGKHLIARYSRTKTSDDDMNEPIVIDNLFDDDNLFKPMDHKFILDLLETSGVSSLSKIQTKDFDLSWN